MVRPIPVTDPDDPRIVEFLGLRDHELRRRRESAGGVLEGVFVTEGDLVVERALRAGYRLRSLLHDAARTRPLPAGIPDVVPAYAAGPYVLQRITGYHLHRGVLACFERRPVPSPNEVLARHGVRRVVVLENVNNPTNVGLIVRAVAGLGFDAVLVDPTSCDPLYRRSSRVSMGEIFALPHAWLDPLPAGLDVVREHGFEILALTPDPTAATLSEVEAAPPERLAVVVGAEGPGLSAATMEAADQRVRIPMYREVDSLNVGVAVAIACYALGPAPGRPPGRRLDLR